MLVHWIWLATRPDMSDREKLAALAYFSDPEDVFCGDKGGYQNLEGVSAKAVEALLDKDLSQAHKILRQCADKDIRICAFGDKEYPKRLKHISDPPMVLYYKGMMPDFDEQPVIAVVGTRRPSAYGISVARRMGYQIAGCGGLVVSGLAKGIDAAAMAGALTAGNSVVGVLGCGVDVVYPKENKTLQLDTQRQGCLISEFPPETPPYRWNFPKRNRIISGLSCGVLVVEAPEISGSLITARQASEQGRDVFVVPGNIDMPSFAGSNALLREGAIIVSSGWDVVSEYQGIYPDKVHKNLALVKTEQIPQENQTAAKVAQKPYSFKKNASFGESNEKIMVDKPAQDAYSDQSSTYQPASQEERIVLEQLGGHERHVDELIALTKLPVGKLLSILTMLEIKGALVRLPGKRFRRKQ